jgi:hypothetical protein
MTEDLNATSAGQAVPEKVFVDIDPDQPVTEIESLCMNCHENVTIHRCSFDSHS